MTKQYNDRDSPLEHDSQFTPMQIEDRVTNINPKQLEHNVILDLDSSVSSQLRDDNRLLLLPKYLH